MKSVAGEIGRAEMVIKEGDFKEEEEAAHFLYHRRRDGTNKATCSLSSEGGEGKFL